MRGRTEDAGLRERLARRIDSELPALPELARCGALDLTHVVSSVVPLEAAPINAALDALQRFRAAGRTVIVP